MKYLKNFEYKINPNPTTMDIKNTVKLAMNQPCFIKISSPWAEFLNTNLALKQYDTVTPRAILNFLRNYMRSHQLHDKTNPQIIHLNDILEKILNRKLLNLKYLSKLVVEQILIIPPIVPCSSNKVPFNFQKYSLKFLPENMNYVSPHHTSFSLKLLFHTYS